MLSGTMGSLPLPPTQWSKSPTQFHSSFHAGQHVPLPHPQLGARMRRSAADRGFPKSSMSQRWQSVEEGTRREKPDQGMKELLKTERARTNPQNHTSPLRNGIARLPQVLRGARSFSFQGKSKKTQKCEAVICKRGLRSQVLSRYHDPRSAAFTCLPPPPPLPLIPVSATPARLPARAHSFWEGACQSIELLMHNHATNHGQDMLISSAWELVWVVLFPCLVTVLSLRYYDGIISTIRCDCVFCNVFCTLWVSDLLKGPSIMFFCCCFFRVGKSFINKKKSHPRTCSLDTSAMYDLDHMLIMHEQNIDPHVTCTTKTYIYSRRC